MCKVEKCWAFLEGLGLPLEKLQIKQILKGRL